MPQPPINLLIQNVLIAKSSLGENLLSQMLDGELGLEVVEKWIALALIIMVSAIQMGNLQV